MENNLDNAKKFLVDNNFEVFAEDLKNVVGKTMRDYAEIISKSQEQNKDKCIENKKKGLHPQFSTSGADLIYLERKRQIEVEGFTAQNDAKYTDDELVSAAICYAMNPAQRNFENDENVSLDLLIWPWHESAWKPTPEDRIKELTKAGALIAAEIDRLKSI